MTAWKVGDEAVCVVLNPQSLCSMGNLRVGSVYCVLEVHPEPYGICLLLDGVRSGHSTGQYQAFRFRKVVRDKHEACEPEFVTLLKRSKVSA